MQMSPTTIPDTELTRQQVQEILLRHRGTQATIAAELLVTQMSVSLVMNGRSVSARILAACQKRAHELLEAKAAEFEDRRVA